MRHWMSAGITLIALAAQSAIAQDFRSLPDEAVQHVPSGWTFPKKIGNFVRQGEPERIQRTAEDVWATYKDDATPLNATVYVYPPGSPAEDRSFEGAKAIIEQDLKKTLFAQLWSSGPFRVGSARPLVGSKLFYKIGIGPSSTQTNLYFFDVGGWIVKFRVTGATVRKETFQEVDAFARDQLWDALALTDQTCTGSACAIDRPLPVHAMLPEMLAQALVVQEVDRVFLKETPPCDAQAIEARLQQPPPKQADGKDVPLELLTTCVPRKGFKASFLRMSLPESALVPIERDSPDGLSLRNPLTFVALNDGRQSHFTALHDGRLTAADLTLIIAALDSKSPAHFATGNKNGKKLAPVVQFIQ